MQILSRLLNNCRESDRQIGKQLGVSGGAVKSRVKKMIESGVIEYFALKIEPPVLGYGAMVYFTSWLQAETIMQF